MHCVVVIVITVGREFLSVSTMFVGRLNAHLVRLRLSSTDAIRHIGQQLDARMICQV